MSRHEGVSCDSCLKGNFRGKRYKCLICYDYDLCATCYDAGATTTRHTTEHPMQCILTRADFDLFYGGEGVTVEQPQAYICPFCSKMGFNETTLQEHVTSDHAETSVEVVCPICAALPGGDPNHVTDDFSAHLALEHRAPREFDEPMGGIRHVRRIPHPGRGGSRARRSNMHFQAPGNTLANLSPSGNREAMDPIAELLSQLTSVRSRAAAAQSVSAQLQNLEMQLQNTRQQLERLPRRQTETQKTNNAVAAAANATLDYAGAVSTTSKTASSNTNSSNSQYLLSRCSELSMTEMERQAVEVDQADRSIFVQELLLSSLAEGLRLNRDSIPPSGSPPSVGTVDSIDNSDGSDSDRPVNDGRKSENPHNKTSSQGKPRLSKPVTNHKKVEREPPPPATNH